MATETRSERLDVRCTKAEIVMLRELAERSGLTASDVVRQLIRQEHLAMPRQRPTRLAPTWSRRS